MPARVTSRRAIKNRSVPVRAVKHAVTTSLLPRSAHGAGDDERTVQYRILGGIPLHGEVTISGSKNAALPLIAATLLVDGKTVLRNVPRLTDTETMLRILEFLGAQVNFVGSTVTVDASRVKNAPIPHELVSKLRGSIVLLGPLLARFGQVEMAYPGGCVLGKRPVHAHLTAFEQLGARNLSTDSVLRLEGHLPGGEIVLPEFSVTATENVLLAASILPQSTTIHLAAAEPHVQDVCQFLRGCGVKIDGIGSHTLTVHGVRSLESTEHRIISDYLEAGAFIIAGLVTKGLVRIKQADRLHLVSFLGAVKRAGGICSMESNGDLLVDGAHSDLAATRVQTNIFPGFPTDLHAPFGVALTQAKGVSRIFEVLFEGRMSYLYELEKMGAHIEILNAHQALIIGPTPLKGRVVASNDIRAGVAMVIAGLCAHGETTITDVRYIERGYDRLERKLVSLGAKIMREEAR